MLAKTWLAFFFHEGVGGGVQFHQMTLTIPALKTKPSLAPPALLKNSTMPQSPTDGCQRTPQVRCHRVVLCSPDCTPASVEWNKWRAQLKRHKTFARQTLFSQHIQICQYCAVLSRGAISCQSEVTSGMFPYLPITAPC